MRRGKMLMRLLEPIAREALVPDLGPETLRAVFDDALADYESQRPGLPREASRGERLMVDLAALTVGFHRALVRHGVEEARARAFTARATWAAYEKMASVPTLISRIGAPEPRQRLQRATDLFRRFPFAAPAYVMEDVDAEDDVVAFDVRRCPVAEHFIAQGLPELCVESWCNLDYPLAEKWGARLERSTTLAGGGPLCDFRWHVRRDEES